MIQRQLSGSCLFYKEFGRGDNKNGCQKQKDMSIMFAEEKKGEKYLCCNEKINLGNSGYGTRDTILTTYVQNNLEGVPARRRPAVIICPGGGYEYQSDRESEPIALEFLKRGYQAFILEYAVLEENETKGLLPYPQMDLAKAVAYVKEHQEVWNVDGEQITILGCSAGGNLCALYSGFYQQDWFIKNDRIQPETNAGTSHDLVLSRDRLQGRMAERG